MNGESKILQSPGLTEFRKLAVFPDAEQVRRGRVGPVKKYPACQAWKDEFSKAQCTKKLISCWSKTNLIAVRRELGSKVKGRQKLDFNVNHEAVLTGDEA